MKPAQETATAWTTQQRQAIEHVAGDLLVSAAAGSGKTAVLAERCARLVCEGVEGGCGVEGLLVLTFTEAAANEMRERIGGAIRAKLRGVEERTAERTRWLQRQAAMVERAGISTLHAFCARVLRQHFSEAGIDPAFELIDEDEARLLRDEVLDEVLARWHKLEPGAEAEGFADFFEAYAQGRDGNCREMVLRVYMMLASTADPAAYLAATRLAYAGGAEGRAKTVRTFLAQTLGEQVRLASLTTERMCADVRRNIGDCAMLTALQGAAAGVAGCLRFLEEGDFAAARVALDVLWPARLATMMEVADFAAIKKRTYEKLKEKVKKLQAETFAATPEELERDLAKLAGPLETLLALVEDFSQTFTAAKRAQNRLDFADLERLTLDLLQRPGAMAATDLRQRFHHVLVDEFQDINPLQAALLAAVRSPARFENRGNLFVVGDVKQSIYGFRLAEPALFLERERAAREMAGPAFVALPHNFRSQPALLSAMNGFFEKLLTLPLAGIRYNDGHALEAPPTKSLSPGEEAGLRAFTGAPVEVQLVAMKSDDGQTAEEGEDMAEPLSAVEEEARMVARRIRAMMNEGRAVTGKDGTQRKLAYRDIAILLRAMKNKAMIFARALANEGIPVHADLSTGYFDAAEVRDTLALLSILDNPQQDIPLATALVGPYGHFSHDDLGIVRLTFDRKTVTFADAVHRYARFGATLRAGVGDAAEQMPPFRAELAERLTTWLEKLEQWRGILRTRPLHEGLAEIYAQSKILPYLSGLEAGTQRVANLHALHQRALRFSSFAKQGLHRFLRFIEKLREQDGDFGEAPVMSEASNVVRILSVHKSKGLEFPVVFVSGLGSKLNIGSGGAGGAVFVHRSFGVGLHVADVERNIFYPSALSETIKRADQRTGIAEELRLLYVALTRARDHLVLTAHVTKEEAVGAVRGRWAGHEGELPEDMLLDGRRVVEWLLPALACGKLRVQWSAAEGCDDPQVTVHVHAAGGAAKGAAVGATVSDGLQERLARGELLPEEAVGDERIEQLLSRVSAPYRFEAEAREPAVRTVSELKSLFAEAEGEAAMAVPLVSTLAASANGAGEEARQRGTATHRVLQFLDFAQTGSAEEIQAQVERLVEKKILTAEEAAAADVAGIVWMMTASPAGARVREAAARKDASEKAVMIRRELPFTWAAPLDPAAPPPDRADWPTIRGTIDLLLVDTAKRTAELLDYKTDSARTWQANLPGHEVQMRYYLRAASDILGMPVERATLVFLSAKESVEVRGEG